MFVVSGECVHIRFTKTVEYNFSGAVSTFPSLSHICSNLKSISYFLSSCFFIVCGKKSLSYHIERTRCQKPKTSGDDAKSLVKSIV